METVIRPALELKLMRPHMCMAHAQSLAAWLATKYKRKHGSVLLQCALGLVKRLHRMIEAQLPRVERRSPRRRGLAGDLPVHDQRCGAHAKTRGERIV